MVESQRGRGGRLNVVESEGETEERLHSEAEVLRNGFLLFFHLLDHNKMLKNDLKNSSRVGDATATTQLLMAYLSLSIRQASSSWI